MRLVALTLILSLLGGGGALASAAAAEQDLGGLPPGPGQEETLYLCSACHSIKLVTQQTLSRKRWDKTLEWMVEEQGMPEPEPDERARILNYLAEHYGPDEQKEECVSPWGRVC